MTPEQFVAKWRNVSTGERATAQSHFNDLCALLGEPTPHQAGGGEGWADVWKRGCFGWEYKGKGKDLKAAFRQLQLYTPTLEYPPLLIVSDIESIVIHTAFTGTVQETHVLTLDDLLDADKRKLLKWAFTEPERLKPGLTREHITEQAARRFGDLAQGLRQRDHWLNPLEWAERVPEVVPGYPDRILPRSGFKAELKKRPLTNLYNAHPAWLARARGALDMAVARAYCGDDYTPDMPDTEILRRLLALNIARAREGVSCIS